MTLSHMEWSEEHTRCEGVRMGLNLESLGTQRIFSSWLIFRAAKNNYPSGKGNTYVGSLGVYSTEDATGARISVFLEGFMEATSCMGRLVL